jgi:hypothetical protein
MWRKVGATASTTIDGQPKEARKKKGNNQNKKRLFFILGQLGVDNLSWLYALMANSTRTIHYIYI